MERSIVGDPSQRFLEELANRLLDNVNVLDLGCGAGIPSTKQLAERFTVTGVDISQAQVRLAHGNVPNATFAHSDFAQLDFDDETFDGVSAFYSVSHTPRDSHAALFQHVARLLKPGGLFLASLGAVDSPDWTGEWLNVPMFFSSYDAGTNSNALRAAGLTLLLDEVVTMQEPEGQAIFLWVLAQKA
jgi:SAM-dependent methyltransferase